MHIHISEKDLKRLQFRLKIIEGKLNIKGYTNEKLKDKVCPNCLLKSFKKSKAIDIEVLSFNKTCSCNFDISPSVSLKISTEKNPKVTFA